MANRTGKGYYTPQGEERVSRIAIGLRLPQSIDDLLRQKYQLKGAKLVEFVREAVREKVERLEEKNS